MSMPSKVGKSGIPTLSIDIPTDEAKTILVNEMSQRTMDEEHPIAEIDGFNTSPLPVSKTRDGMCLQFTDIPNHDIAIKDTDEWCQFTLDILRVNDGEFKKFQKPNIVGALLMLRGALIIKYGKTDINQFKVDYSPSNINTARLGDLSKNIAYVCCEYTTWTRETSQRRLNVMKVILTRWCGVSKAQCGRLKLSKETKERDPRLPGKYATLSKSDPVKHLLQQWATEIEIVSKNECTQSKCAILRYWINTLLPAFDLTLEGWSVEMANQAVSSKLSKELARKLVGNTTGSRKNAGWFQMFIQHIAKTPYRFNTEEILEIRKNVARKKKVKELESMGEDIHRISSAHVDMLYEQAKDAGICDYVCFFILLSTGIRNGGLTNMCIEHIADKVNGRWVSRKTWVTLEKKEKAHSFDVRKPLQSMMDEWLNDARPATQSVYVFPGVGELPANTNVIREMVKKWMRGAGLSGTCYHPHAFRHTYAHILLDLGVPVHVIQRCLGHKSISTTLNFYLKRNGADASKEVNDMLDRKRELSSQEKFVKFIPKCMMPWHKTSSKNPRKKQKVALF